MTNHKPTKHITRFLNNKRAASVALTTMIITAGVLAAGIAILYWATSWGNVASQEYSKTITNNQNAASEKLAFEYMSYSTIDKSLTVYIINCGKVDNVAIARLYIWDSTHQITGTYESPALQTIDDSTTITGGLPMGGEGKIIITSQDGLPTLSGYYTIRLVTQRGRNFDGSFSTP